MVLPLSIRKNIRDNEGKAKENLEKIKAASGKEFVLDVNWEENVGKIDYNKDLIGVLYQSEVLEKFAVTVAKHLQDPLVKEAFNEATSQNKITIRINPTASAYWAVLFENGTIVIEHLPTVSNVNNLTVVDIAKALPVTGLPVPVRQNISENKPKADEYLASIAKTTGAGEWVVEVDWDAVVAKIDKYAAEKIGTTYLKEALYYVDELLKNKLKDDLIKEAFNEATPARTITIGMNDKLDKYWDLSIKDGGLFLQSLPQLANIANIGAYNLSAIIPSPGLISLVARINLKDTKESGDKALKKISDATGVEWTLEDASVEGFYAGLDQYERLRVGDIINKDVLPNLAENIAKATKDDMVKEGLLETASAHTIRLAADPKASNYWAIKFDNGVLVITGRPPIANVNNIGVIDIEKLL